MDTPLVRVEEGKPMGQLWGLIYEGISEDGQWIHTDLNEDGEITGDDRAVLGNGLPDFELGWGNSFLNSVILMPIYLSEVYLDMT
jgi:hypothetical protein